MQPTREVIVRAILTIEQHSRGFRQWQCPACGCWMDNHVRHAECCEILHRVVQVNNSEHPAD